MKNLRVRAVFWTNTKRYHVMPIFSQDRKVSRNRNKVETEKKVEFVTPYTQTKQIFIVHKKIILKWEKQSGVYLNLQKGVFRQLKQNLSDILNCFTVKSVDYIQYK